MASRKVSEEGQDLFGDLLAWELFDVDLDPKILLRQASLQDLSLVQANALEIADRIPESIALGMVSLELSYRSGRVADWSYERDGKEVKLFVKMKEAAKHITLNFELSSAASAH